MYARNIKAWLTLSCLALAAGSAAHAELADRDKPMKITYRTMENDLKDKNNEITTLDGNVVMVQGTLEVLADHAVVRQNQKGDQYLTATGRPVKMKQKLDCDEGWMDGHADRVEFDGEKNEAKFIGNAYVNKPSAQTTGDIIIYNTATSSWKVVGGDKPGYMELQPKSKKPAAPNAAAPVPCKPAP